jgi:tetraacyldisaccharide-1-P 4'-kinase
LANEAQSAGATCLITTAKDATKLSTDQLSLPCVVLQIKIKIDDETRLTSMLGNVLVQARKLDQKG